MNVSRAKVKDWWKRLLRIATLQHGFEPERLINDSVQQILKRG